MFWGKTIHIFVISILLVGGFSGTYASRESKFLVKTSLEKALNLGIIYVDADVSGSTHDGTSWATAYKTVQDALTTANSGTQIWVAEGVYYPDKGSGQTDDDHTSTFMLKDEVAIYGGFVGTESSLDERDWETHVTVLSGDIDHETNPDITDLDGVVTDTNMITGDNAYHVVSSIGVTTNAIIDGFTITAGYDNSEWIMEDPCDPGHDCGGGMYNGYDSNPMVSNIIFSGNWAIWRGGGMFNRTSNPTLDNVTFFGNSAVVGGGMMNYNYSNPVLIDVTFSGNSAGEGGGMSNDASHPMLTNVTFSDNYAKESGGGMYTEGGNPTLAYVIFTDNSANFNGGGMFIAGGSPTLTNVTFTDNSAGSKGGGMYNVACTPTLRNVTFIQNSAAVVGGGMYNFDCSPTLTNVTFSGNTAIKDGGGMYNYLYAHNKSPVLINTIMWGNIAGNGSNQIKNNNITPMISYCDIQDSGGSGEGWDSSLGIDSGGNIDADPLFIDPFNDDLHLRPGSPAIDAGDDSVCPLTDLDGIPRPYGEGCDMGVYEFSGVKIYLPLVRLE